jgi:hypothetical protein
MIAVSCFISKEFAFLQSGTKSYAEGILEPSPDISDSAPLLEGHQAIFRDAQAPIVALHHRADFVNPITADLHLRRKFLQH